MNIADNLPNSKESRIRIITDEPSSIDSLDFKNYAKRLAEIITGSEPRFSIGIFGGWGTGKTSLMKMICDELKSYDSGDAKILPVWFDAWKFEKEKYIAVIPMIRTIRIALENTSRTGKLRTLRKGLDRTFAAFAQATDINLGLDRFGSVQTNLSKFLDVLKSDGSIKIGDETVNYNSHFTDNLSTALDRIRKKYDFRIVVFIDDLDRCVPERALEVLESIKVFFDIKGIVFVIGMDPASIDKIVSVKYGERTTVSGLDYIQKIVQLPFKIPTWKESDISKFIEDMTNSLKGSALYNEFILNKDLIVKAVPLNPRQVKRFINTVILTKSVFNKDFDKLLVVQALNFRLEWKNILEFITRDDRRTEFIKKYKQLKHGTAKVTMEEFTKSMLDNYPSFTDIFGIDRPVLKNDDSLTTFLDSGAIDILSRIEKMEDYRRALDTTSLKKITQYEESQLSPIWFSHKELIFDAGLNDSGRFFKWTEKSQFWDWNNCIISCVALPDAKKIKFIVRRSRIIYSEYRKKEITQRYMIGFDVDISTNFNIVEDMYSEPIDNNARTYGGPRTRWYIPLGNDHYIWQWQNGKAKEDSEIFRILNNIKKTVHDETPKGSGKLFNVEANDSDKERIVPVIYIPAVPHWGNFIGEVHCHRINGGEEIEVSIIFDTIGHHELLGGAYKSLRTRLYGKVVDVESFRIKLHDGNPEFFDMEGIYGGDLQIENNTAHLSNNVNIKHYYGNIKHPIIFINTMNHAMAEHDTNKNLWKWEYIPWYEDSPVIFGEKSRKEIDKGL